MNAKLTENSSISLGLMWIIMSIVIGAVVYNIRANANTSERIAVVEGISRENSSDVLEIKESRVQGMAGLQDFEKEILQRLTRIEVKLDSRR